MIASLPRAHLGSLKVLQILVNYSQKTSIWGTGESATPDLELTFSVDANVNACIFFLKVSPVGHSSRVYRVSA